MNAHAQLRFKRLENKKNSTRQCRRLWTVVLSVVDAAASFSLYRAKVQLAIFDAEYHILQACMNIYVYSL